MEELARKLMAWIGEQVSAANAKGVVVGLSGGLDSSVVAVLCKSASPHATLGVILPCHSSRRDIEDAEEIATKFDIPTQTIVLDEVFDLLLTKLPTQGFGPMAQPEGYTPATQKMAEANLKPRLRMITLYYLANRLNYLVVGTGNRSELAVGYFTKYGDGGVDLLPLGNLVKGQVKRLAVYLSVPKQIIEKTPSAGLWEGQTDENEMGISYDDLDRYLTAGQAERRVKERVDALASASAHKRAMPPIPPF